MPSAVHQRRFSSRARALLASLQEHFRRMEDEFNGEMGLVPRAEQPAEAPPVQPRQPSNLQGLLRFAIEATRGEDAPAAGPRPPPLDAERRSFLENAIGSVAVDVTAELEEGIRRLSDRGLISRITVDREPPADVVEWFDALETHAAQLDAAVGFYKLGGFAVFPVCLSCENLSVRSMACRLLAALCQNNPFCQTRVLECGYLRALVSMFDAEQDAGLMANLMYAISCIIRHHDPCIKAFIDDGLHILEKAFQSPLCAKAAFLLSSIYPENTHIADKLVSLGLVRALIAALPKRRSHVSEQILCALHTLLIEQNAALMDEMRTERYGLKETLVDYLGGEDLNKPDTEYIEEKEYCEDLLSVLFKGSTNKSRLKDQTDQSVDR